MIMQLSGKYKSNEYSMLQHYKFNNNLTADGHVIKPTGF